MSAPSAHPEEAHGAEEAADHGADHGHESEGIWAKIKRISQSVWLKVKTWFKSVFSSNHGGHDAHASTSSEAHGDDHGAEAHDSGGGGHAVPAPAH